jgi:TolB-like protein
MLPRHRDDTANGIAEDLTTNLSRMPSFLVIARNSAFTYKGKPIDIRRASGGAFA